MVSCCPVGGSVLRLDQVRPEASETMLVSCMILVNIKIIFWLCRVSHRSKISLLDASYIVCFVVLRSLSQSLKSWIYISGIAFRAIEHLFNGLTWYFQRLFSAQNSLLSSRITHTLVKNELAERLRACSLLETVETFRMDRISYFIVLVGL